MLIAIACMAVFAGAFAQSTIGFGLAIIAAPILFAIDPAYVPAPITLIALVLSCLNTWRYRQNVSLKGLTAAIAGRVPGSALGAALLLWIDVQSLSLWLGISVLLAVLVSLAPYPLKPTPGRMASAGFVSGFMGTSSSIGGPPMALLLQHEDADRIRGNLSAFFIASCVMSLVMLAPVGYLGTQQLWLALPLLPASLAGYVVATYTVNRINKGHIRTMSLVMCTVSGLAAVLNYWW